MSRRTGLFVFAAVLLAVTIAKIVIVGLGPDHDGDAYAHAMAGRRMLLDPGDVSVHWVWLPFLHSLYAAATAMGSGLTNVRFVNIAASTVSPIVLYAWLRHHERTTTPPAADTQSATSPRGSPIPWLAASLLAIEPLSLWLGTTGQTEPLFQLFILGASYALARRAFVATGLLFATATLTRYEAWPLLPVIGILAAIDVQARISSELPPPARSSALRASGAGAAPKSLPPVAQGAARLGSQAPVVNPSPFQSEAHPTVSAATPDSPAREDGLSPDHDFGTPVVWRRLAAHLHASLSWFLPLAAVAGWCLFHARATNEPLQFLRLNREFVSGFLGGVGYTWGKQPILPLMALQYIALVPVWNMLGAAHLLSFAGLARAARRYLSRKAPADAGTTSSFDLPLTLLVIGLALLAVVTLGFLRGAHLGLPRHAVVLAPFFCALVAAGTLPFADRLARRFPRFAAPRGHHIVAALVLATVFFARTLPETLALASATRTAFSAQAAAAQALTAVARPGEPIFCEDGKIEVLSQLSPDRFTRWQIPDVSPFHIHIAARQHGSALVVSSPARAAHLPGGTPVWTGEGLTIFRYEYEVWSTGAGGRN